MGATADFKPPCDAANAAPFGPAVIEKRTANTPLANLGTSFMEFTETGASDPWTLRYEETIYVVAGRLELDIIEDGVTGVTGATVVGDVGELLVLPEGTTVRYRADKGTRLVLSITPVNWRDRTN
ncbi:hypothetical protein HC031_09160 [Planosporangium thailandense]|uniref:Ethanolamine utilization protein EutQ n=1 Tax=Planosporangium thailandense TaxID=765197 RepID=A0ABX0XV23_9ACTN|nr:hypothetical protein [Planosporangium thailandense]NJC69886.1 hypothetical protein [Planosporangium thailandense]